MSFTLHQTTPVTNIALTATAVMTMMNTTGAMMKTVMMDAWGMNQLGGLSALLVGDGFDESVVLGMG